MKNTIIEEMREIKGTKRSSRKGSVIRSKFKKMSSQVQETEYINSVAKHLNKNQDKSKNEMGESKDLTKSNKIKDEKKKNLQKGDYGTPQDYLNSITISIDCEKDLELYSMNWCRSTNEMSVVGVQIISNRLVEAYGGKSYLIRAYH